MHPAFRTRVLVAVLAACSLAGMGSCSSGGGDSADRPAASTTGAGEGSTPSTTAEEDEAIDPAGAEDVAAIAGVFLDDGRTLIDLQRNDSTETVQRRVRELRNALFRADGALRKVDVADPTLTAAVGDFYAAAGDSIAAFDTMTTADPASLGQNEATALNVAIIEAFDAAVTLQDASLAVAAGKPVPTDAGPSAALRPLADLPALPDAPPYVRKPAPELPRDEAGPCGTMSAALAVPPTHYAAVLLEDSSINGEARVLAFETDAEAKAYVDAATAYVDCPDADGFASVEVEPRGSDGAKVSTVYTDGIAVTLLLEADGTWVRSVLVEGDQLIGQGAGSVTAERAEAILTAIS